ncbi:MAG: response regulator [Pseudomonadota bacterium]
MKILIVEDNCLLAFFVEDLLREAGHDIIGPAASYEEAIRLINIDSPDMGLLDINLAGTKTGIDLSHELYDRNIPSIFMSSSLIGLGDEKFSVGSLPKPYRLQSVVETVEYLRCHIKGTLTPPLPLGFVLFGGGKGASRPAVH